MAQGAALEPFPAASRRAVACRSREVPLAAKVAFLKTPDAYGRPLDPVDCRETHMSWVFSTADEVNKLKKPIRLPYLDFSSLERRHAACRAELVHETGRPASMSTSPWSH